MVLSPSTKESPSSSTGSLFMNRQFRILSIRKLFLSEHLTNPFSDCTIEEIVKWRRSHGKTTIETRGSPGIIGIDVCRFRKSCDHAVFNTTQFRIFEGMSRYRCSIDGAIIRAPTSLSQGNSDQGTLLNKGFITK